MQKFTVIAALVVGAFLVTSCSDTDARVTATGPTTLAMEPASFNVVQSPLSPKPAPFAFCPAFPPSTVVVQLSIRAGTLSLSVIEINLQFVDTSGIRMPQVTLPAPVMTTQFGTALVEARQTRLFPLSLGLGCGFGQRGTITVVVVTRDQNGSMNTGQVSVLVR
jgi:hypothetical protein